MTRRRALPPSRLRVGAWCALVALALGGPAAAAKPSTPQQIKSALDQRNVHESVVPFELTPEIAGWVHDRISRGASRKARLEILIEQLLGPKGLAIDYSRGRTGTAAEVFETRSANCLSFTHLFVGMAREVGVPVFFLEVKDLEDYTKDGDLIVHSDHIAVGFGPAHEMTLIDFAVENGTKYRKIKPISDLTATALFYSNRSTEYLRTGQLEAALEWATSAVRIDPELSGSWINYGVALRRNGRNREAEEAYRTALELDSSQYAAYQNLAALLRLEGRSQEALELLALTDRSGNRNPFSYLALGDLSLRSGRQDEAERFYRRAAHLNDDEAEPLAALGLVVLDSNPRQAARLLKRARRLDPSEPRVTRLEAAVARHRRRPPPGT